MKTLYDFHVETRQSRKWLIEGLTMKYHELCTTLAELEWNRDHGKATGLQFKWLQGRVNRAARKVARCKRLLKQIQETKGKDVHD